ncbi:MAG: hypothetical protein K2M60_08730 [Lachnospiraceae bacterium]|nr:hypothetical protein [Lachnospiraceae bacterium]MDE6251942.1 hypothetical protein [Lachnospiraceae bacterium]
MIKYMLFYATEEDIKICLFVEESRIKDVIYTTGEMYDGTIIELINSVSGPILE